jgi:four helix bundle protein
MDLVVKSYELSQRLPTRETYGLVAQMQRAAVSIPANIAEGQGRDHLGDYLHPETRHLKPETLQPHS